MTTYAACDPRAPHIIRGFITRDKGAKLAGDFLYKRTTRERVKSEAIAVGMEWHPKRGYVRHVAEPAPIDPIVALTAKVDELQGQLAAVLKQL